MTPKRKKELKKLLKEAKIEQSKFGRMIYQNWIEKTEKKLKEKMKKCPKCGRFMEYDGMNDYHYICNKCDMFYCFEDGCHCCEGIENVEEE